RGRRERTELGAERRSTSGLRATICGPLATEWPPKGLRSSSGPPSRRCSRRARTCWARVRVLSAMLASPRIVETLAATLGVAFQGQRHEAVNQVRAGEAAGGPQLRVHANLGETRQGVQFVQVHFATLL